MDRKKYGVYLLASSFAAALHDGPFEQPEGYSDPCMNFCGSFSRVKIVFQEPARRSHTDRLLDTLQHLLLSHDSRKYDRIALSSQNQFLFLTNPLTRE
jgi:hypothetical protein